MLKWIKVRQDPATRSLGGSSLDSENDASVETSVDYKGEDEDDSGMEREDSPGIDLRDLKKVGMVFCPFEMSISKNDGGRLLRIFHAKKSICDYFSILVQFFR